MRYQFPIITHIDQIRQAIASKPEFIIAEREHYDVVNYLVVHPDTFDGPDGPLLRECRGLVFSKNGDLIARRFHKFFNVEEKEETKIKHIDLSKPYVILEKLDGSMISPIPIGNSIRWGTKMGITDISMGAEEFVSGSSYEEFAGELITNCNMTPIFEWCSNKQRIVIDQPKDRLVLIAIRDNETGQYLKYKDMVDLAMINHIEVVKAYPGTIESMEELVNNTRSMENAEGFVVRFDTGHMVKIKSDWYVRIHKAKGALANEKNVVSLIINQQMDDVKSFLLEEDRQKLITKEILFANGLDNRANIIYTNIKNEYGVCNGEKKIFALERQQDYPVLERSIMFALWKPTVTVAEVREAMIKYISKKTGSQTSIDQIRSLWEGHNLSIWSEK